MEITAQNYHEDRTHVSKSGLDLINRAPKHFQYRYLSGEYEDDETKRWKGVGRAIHMATTEPQLFPANFVKAPKVDRRTNKGKQEWAEFEEYAGTKTLLTEAEYELCMRASESLRAHPVVKKAIRVGIAEKVITWTDPTTGIACKCMPDWMQSNGLIIDIKSTENASLKGFRKSVWKFRYHVQEAFYSDGIQLATGIEPVFMFAVVEKEPPYISEVYTLEPEWVEMGRNAYLADLQKLKECRASGVWGGYNEELITKIGLD